MKTVRTVQRIEEIVKEDSQFSKPSKFKINNWVKVYSGSYENHEFIIKDIRYSYDTLWRGREGFQYYNQSYGWVNEENLTKV